MSLTEWLKTAYGVDFLPGGGLHGGPLAEAFCRALEEAGLDYGTQRAALVEAADRRHDLAFGNACLDHAEAIDAYLARRAALVDREVRKCRSGVVKNKEWAAGAEYAELRFAAARPPDGDLLDAVDDMCRRLAGEGYVELRDDVVRDLRQGLGYYRPGEDPVRRRHTVRWLRGQNALLCWIAVMLGGRDPLIRVAGGAPGCWVTAASLFVDRQGRAFTYARLEHGVLRNELQERWLLSLIPRSPWF